MQCGSSLDHKDRIKLSDFVTMELKAYFKEDNIRSIPSLFDGLKPILRRVLFVAFEEDIVTVLPVPSFSGLVIECTSYRHCGEVL